MLGRKLWKLLYLALVIVVLVVVFVMPALASDHETDVGAAEGVAVVIGIPFILGLTEVIKRATDVPSRFVPLIALVLGVGDGYLLHLSHETAHTLAEALAGGAVAGLASVGLFAGGRSVLKPSEDKPELPVPPSH